MKIFHRNGGKNSIVSKSFIFLDLQQLLFKNI